MVGARDCERAGEYIVFWLYFFYSSSLISKRGMSSGRICYLVCYIDENILNSVDVLISLSLISLFNHIV